MKKLIYSLLPVLFLLLGAASSNAQTNGSVQSNGYVNGQVVPLNPATTIRILREAQPYFETHAGLSLGQLIQLYREGACTITLVNTMPPSLTFEVSSGGILIVVIIDEA
jgi:hypothetical protein